MLGYSTTLEIRSDGTFTKIQYHRMFTQTFNGTYSQDEFGRVMFVATEMIGPILASDPEDMVTELNHSYWANCGINSVGHLVVSSDSEPVDDFLQRIRWETYCRE